MLPRRLSRYAPLLIAVVLMGLLAVLAMLEHRWIGQLSQMQRHRMHAGLLASGLRFSEDFDREVTRAWLYFLPDPADAGDPRQRVVRRMEHWAAEAPRPQLIQELYYVHRDAAGAWNAEVLRPGARQFEPVSWPADLEPLRRHLARVSDRIHAVPMLADTPALVVPLVSVRRSAGEERHPGELLVVRLDAREITGEILPALTRRHFGEPQEREYAVAVIAGGGSGRVIFQSD
ncbi:MAG TPA: hypothetical protein VMW27_05795, partial [Thermoanaerobaculia bacterium]|nr:hypothetical protein [Thermoanaerobaculia bacterium]